jgi:hypothetical protein
MSTKKTFNVWLGNPQALKYYWNDLCEEVYKHFKYVTAQHGEFSRVLVRSTMTKPVLHANELLVYIINAKPSSVVSQRFGSGGGTGGYTAFERSGSHVTASEAYMHASGDEARLKPRELAMIIYHEAMHNILQEGDELHRRGGLAAENIHYDTAKHRTENDKAMAKALSKMAPQWLDGWNYAKPFEKIDIHKSGDPLDGL